MAETRRIFVSTPQDLEAERGVIGKAIAELPVQLAIEIRRTPLLPTYDEGFEHVANCNRVHFLPGNDITRWRGWIERQHRGWSDLCYRCARSIPLTSHIASPQPVW